MPHSHHSHSGQFCGHAANTLEEVVQAAIAKKMSVFCLTEHMPRDQEDFYPAEDKSHTAASLVALYDAFHAEATRLRAQYAGQITLLIGFETEWIRLRSRTIIQDLLRTHPLDLFVGSVHHVHTIPIDYDHALYHRARSVAGGTEGLFADYFDAQYAMLQAVNPPVVGHFDVIRLHSDNAERSLRLWPVVWVKIERNLKYVAAYGGVLEVNGSALRKGLGEPYPTVEICQAFGAMGGRFCLSDDSHGVAQVGLNYGRVLEAVERAGIAEMWHLEPRDKTGTPPFDHRFPNVQWKAVALDELRTHAFWKQ